MDCGGAQDVACWALRRTKDSPGEGPPCTCWAIFELLPIRVPVGRLRACSGAELLAYHDVQSQATVNPTIFNATEVCR